jgi:hypothetical protein
VKFVKSQSAMEYLMTYGWAILIIAFVLAALYSLGIFNPVTFSAKAQPGACSVYRPSGIGSTSEIALNGVCSNLLPQFIQSTGSATCPSAGDPVYVPQLLQTSASAITVSFWVEPYNYNTAADYFYLGGTPPFYCTTTATGLPQCGNGVSGLTTATIPTQLNVWSFVTVTVSASGTEQIYLDGQPAGAGVFSGVPLPSITSFNIFSAHSAAACVYGGMSNVQVYSTALSQQSVSALYQEGIGGAPIDLDDLAGWWPLNGDPNDYSGNLQDGVTNGISYDSNWWNTYTTP